MVKVLTEPVSARDKARASEVKSEQKKKIERKEGVNRVRQSEMGRERKETLWPQSFYKY